MKAVICDRYGPPEVLQIRDVPVPTLTPNDVLVQVHATTVTSGDWRIRSLEMPPGFGPFGRLIFGLKKPRQPILGTELSGVIAAVGRDVTNFSVGDEVIAFTGGMRMGAHAEYVSVRADGPIARKPANLSHEEAAALCFGGTTAWHFLQKAEVGNSAKPGQRVLINGASGSVGSAAVSLAKYLGAHVTGVCSGANAEMVRALGADEVIDYTQDDFTRGREPFDVILDCVGTAPYARSASAMRDGGRLVLILAGLNEMLKAPWHSLTTRHKILAGPASENPEYVRQIAELATAGKFRPHIDSVFPLEEIVEAHRRVDSGRKRGNVVVRIAFPGTPIA